MCTRWNRRTHWILSVFLLVGCAGCPLVTRVEHSGSEAKVSTIADNSNEAQGDALPSSDQPQDSTAAANSEPVATTSTEAAEGENISGGEDQVVSEAAQIQVVPTIQTTDKRWPLFRGDSFSSGVAASVLPPNPELLWKYTVEDGMFETAPAIVDGVVYAADGDGVLHAIDLQTGEKKWTFAGTLGFVAAPAVHNGRVYIGDLDGKFYCVDAHSGEKLWDFTAEAEIDSSANFYQENVVFGSQDASLYCLTADKGAPVWKFTIEDQIRCTPTIVENRCFLAGCDGKLHIVDLDKGEAIDAVPIDSPTGTTPAVLGQHVYFGTHAGVFFAIDWKNAKVDWKFEHEVSPSEYRASAAVTKSHIVVGDRGRRLFALNPVDGEMLWEFPSKRNIDGSPVIVGDRVFVGGGDGNIYGLNLQDGKEVWKYEAGGGFIGSPAVADGKLLIASEDGIVYCFGAKK
jgi:outer membrane protein assembly factor BamB